MVLATAHPRHPAKFDNAVKMALEEEKGFDFEDVLPEQIIGLVDLPRRVMHAQKSGGLEGIRKLIVKEVEKESNDTSSDPYLFQTPCNRQEFEKQGWRTVKHNTT